MKNALKYFRNKVNMGIEGIAVSTLWILEDKYVRPIDKKHNLLVYYKSHEYWYDEVENPVELLERQNKPLVKNIKNLKAIIKLN